MTVPEPAVPAPSSLPGWVPVERRWFGFDRRTIAPALVVLAVALFFNLALPAIDDAVPYDDPVEAGDVMVLRDGVTFAPPVGWEIEDGVRRGEEPVNSSTPTTATVSNGRVTVRLTTGPFDGTPQELLDQLEKTTDALNKSGPKVTGGRASVRTDSGVTGVMARYVSASTDGAITAFVVDGVGLEVEVVAAKAAPTGDAQAVASLIRSITFESEEGR
ncbi:hypothetical protein [Mumia sp. DW29H23]|uniref:hypothetical protein n=1 Tax=Mumia sp. DW29H23 TaxID=3421241 RepID=UPI003D68A705